MKIKDKHFVDFYSFFAGIYKCPNCNEEKIVEAFMFCPMCGTQIVFEHKTYQGTWGKRPSFEELGLVKKED